MRRVLTLLSVVLVLTLALPGRPVTAEPMRWQAYEVAIWQMAQRGWYGGGPLLIDPDLNAKAQVHADRMAREGRIYHQDLHDLLLRGWHYAGENVAYGRSTWDAHEAMSYSPAHLANSLDPRWRGIGVGAAYGHGGRAYIAVVFGGFP